jgi:uncharacterized protein (DUF1330 family)
LPNKDLPGLSESGFRPLGKELTVPAYVIADVRITTPGEYSEYVRRTPATIEQFGGRFVIRGGKAEDLEGDWHPDRIVVVEFSSYEQAKQWYRSPGYSALIPIRQRHSTSRLIVVEGVS